MNEPSELAPLATKIPAKPSPWASPFINLEQVIPDTFFDLRAYWHILEKRRWTVLTVALLLTTAVAVYSFKMQPEYEATARVAVEAETPHIQSLNELDREGQTDETFIETQVQVLQSDNLAWRTIQELRLAENPEFYDARNAKPVRGVDPRAAQQNLLLGIFRDSLKVDRVPNSRLIEVKFESTDPRLASRGANALVSNYIEDNFRQKYDATRQASGWMEQQLDELKAKVEKSQTALVNYERQYNIVNVGDKQSVVEQRLSDLSRELTAAQGDRLEKESRYELVKGSPDQVGYVTQNELLQKLEEKSADINASYVDALEQYGPNFPKVVRLRDQSKEIQTLIERERKRILGQMHNDYEAAIGREKLLQQAVAQGKTEVGQLNQLLIQHNMLKREFDTNQQLYDNLLQRLKDATVSAGLRATNIQVVDQAITPAFPVRPKKVLNISIGLLVGLILGVTVAFVQQGLDTSIKSVEDVESITNCPTLAVIPTGMRNGHMSWYSRRIEGEPATSPTQVELTMLTQTNSALAEAYRSLRTSVLLSTAPHPPQAILITSSQPNEGKTCTSVNLALALAQRGPRVLLVDADLRKPGVSRRLGLEASRGLSSVLTGAHKIEEVLQDIEGMPNLRVMSAGPRPPNPAELLSSPSMENVLAELRSKFDHIVIDSPPLLLVTDATILSRMVDGCVLVAEPGTTTRGGLQRAHRTLQGIGARIMGIALNKVDHRDGSYYQYYYGYYYRSYYGSEVDKASQSSERN